MSEYKERLTVEDLFKVEDGLPEADRTALESYLSRFANPKQEDGKHACINCGSKIDGFMQALGLAEAYRWGIVHGEAQCSGCGWPARGMHYIKRADGTEICTICNLFLPYHQDEVSPAPPAPRSEA